MCVACALQLPMRGQGRMEDLSYLNTPYARCKMIEEYNNKSTKKEIRDDGNEQGNKGNDIEECAARTVTKAGAEFEQIGRRIWVKSWPRNALLGKGDDSTYELKGKRFYRERS